MQLSKRLLMTAGCVSIGNKTADIGCDHAYLSIYLIQQGIASKVLATDIRPGPLAAARENVKKYQMTDQIELRLSDGFAGLSPYEADTVVIAGMGGRRMVSILADGMPCVRAAKELVLSPHAEVWRVRRFLTGNGLRILQEDMCEDAGIYYTVVKAVQAGRPGLPLMEAAAGDQPASLAEAYGESLLNSRHPVLLEYLTKELRKNLSVQDRLLGQRTEKADIRLAGCRREEERIRDALRYYP